jgi:hypothetical protein
MNDALLGSVGSVSTRISLQQGASGTRRNARHGPFNFDHRDVAPTAEGTGHAPCSRVCRLTCYSINTLPREPAHCSLNSLSGDRRGRMCVVEKGRNQEGSIYLTIKARRDRGQ